MSHQQQQQRLQQHQNCVHNLLNTNSQSFGKMSSNGPRGALECALLPALSKLAVTHHRSVDLLNLANALKQAEKLSPGLCDHFVTELLTTLVYPQASNSELRAAIDRLTTM